MSALSGRIVAAVLRHRRSFPRWVNRSIDAVAENPTGPLGWLASRVLWRYSEADVPEPTRPPLAEPAVHIAPVNYAEQGFAWARALVASGLDATNSAVDVPGGYSFAADRVVPMAVFERSERWQKAELEAVSAYSHVLIEAERPIFSRLFHRDVAREAAVLTQRGVNVAFIAHGTDARLPSRHAASSEWSPFRDTDVYFDKIERDAAKNIALLKALGRPTFASTPDLIDDLPFAHWCPVVVDPQRWSVPRPEYDGPLRVVHAPTNPQIKGTAMIEPILERLDALGVITYRRIVHVPHAEMPEVFANADVVLDQFRLGSFGVAACEAMAAGAVTVAHTTDQVRARVREATGRDLPIVDATPDTLESVLRALADDRADLARRSEQSQTYVRDVHDGRLSARVLRENWIDTDPVAFDAPAAEIVIAAHDPNRDVERAVASVVRSRRARAIVVAHNTPRTGIVDKLGTLAQHPRVEVLELQDGVRSPAGPFNLGLDQATADWVGVLGSDDELAAGAIDGWLERAMRTSADIIVPLVRDADTGRVTSTPPMRRRHVVDPVKDRIAYRSAPLGLIRRDVLADTRFTSGLGSGEDIAVSVELWFAGHRITFAEDAPAYLVHADAPTRVTSTNRPIAHDMAFLPALEETLDRLALVGRRRRAIVTKILRINVFQLVLNRSTAPWSEGERRELAAVTRAVLDLDPTCVRSLSIVERRLVDAMIDVDTPREALVSLARKRTDPRVPMAILTRDPRGLFAADAPLRFGLAQRALSRRAGVSSPGA